jgi:hypothetical protein
MILKKLLGLVFIKNLSRKIIDQIHNIYIYKNMIIIKYILIKYL